MADEVEVLQTRCKQGKLIVTANEVRIELSTLLGMVGLGQKVARARALRRDAITRVDTEAGGRGLGAWTNLVFHGQTPDALLRADLVNVKAAQQIVEMLQETGTN